MVANGHGDAVACGRECEKPQAESFSGPSTQDTPSGPGSPVFGDPRTCPEDWD